MRSIISIKMYVEVDMRDEVKMTNNNLFIVGLPCYASDAVFSYDAKNNGINDNFFPISVVP